MNKKNLLINWGWITVSIICTALGFFGLYSGKSVLSIVFGAFLIFAGIYIFVKKRREEDVKVNEKVFDDFPQLKGFE